MVLSPIDHDFFIPPGDYSEHSDSYVGWLVSLARFCQPWKHALPSRTLYRCLGICIPAYAESADLITLPGLTGREQERLVLRLAAIRSRVWWIGGVAVVSGFLVWLIGSMPTLAESPIAPISIGLLIGIGVSYAVVIPRWFNEIYSFTEVLRLREDKKRRTEAALKQIDEGKKKNF
jgi:hypothetical protein